MADRYYTTAGAAPFSPALDALWDAVVADLAACLMSQNPASYAQQSPLASAATGVANEDKAHFQLFIGPLAAQTFGGTVKGQFLARESNTNDDARAQMCIRVISPAGTVRGTVLAGSAAALSSEFPVSSLNTGIVNRKFPLAAISPAALSAVAALDGDYLVVELGERNHGTGTATIRIFSGEPSATTDLPENETTGGDGNSGSTYRGWIEFSQTVLLLKAAVDSGAGSATSSLVASHARTDAGTGTEPAAGLIASLPRTDAGTGTEAAASLAATLTPTDTATGTETLGDRQMVLADSGVGTDTASVEIVVVAVTPRPLPATLEEVLRGHHQPIARLLFLAGDLETVLHTIDAVVDGDNQWLLSGNVVMDRRRNVHRSANVRVVNKFGLYDPVNSDSLVWPNRIVRLERGARIGGVPQYRPLITGLLDDWGVAADSGVVSFNVWSRLHQADQQFPLAVTYPAGTLVDDAIRDMAQRAGMGTTDAFYDLDSGGLSLPDARTYDSDDNILNAMVKLAFDNGLDLYDDGAGVLILRPFVDPATTTEAWHFERGTDAVMTELTRSGKATTVYNRAVVVGIGSDLYPMRAEARVSNPTDPLYNPVDGSGPVGDRPRPTYTTSDVTGQQALNDLAYRLLVEGALFEESLAAAAVPIPILGSRDVVRVTGAGADDKFLLDTVSMPVGPGAMRMTTRKVRSLVAE